MLLVQDVRPDGDACTVDICAIARTDDDARADESTIDVLSDLHE